MSRGKASRTRRRKGSGIVPFFEEVLAPDKYHRLYDFSFLQLESSVATLKSVALPRHLLDLSVVLFMVGIGLYELSGWKKNTNPGGTAYRNVFVVFIVTICAYVVYQTLIIVGMAYDAKKKDDELGTGSLREVLHLSSDLKAFRESLRVIHEELHPSTDHLGNQLRELVQELRELRSAMTTPR